MIVCCWNFVVVAMIMEMETGDEMKFDIFALLQEWMRFLVARENMPKERKDEKTLERCFVQLSKLQKSSWKSQVDDEHAKCCVRQW